MTASVRPRRSALYLPGNNTRALRKGKTLPADVVIFDLEDAVGFEDKTQARDRVLETIAAGEYVGPELVVRINGSGTAWHLDDVAAVARSGADGVLVPKVDSPDEVRTLSAALDEAGAPADLALWLMIETPGAFLRVESIASASDRVRVLVVGSNDLLEDLHALHQPDRAPIMTALSLVVLGARAAGRSVLDGVFNKLDDHAGFETEAARGRAMGFDGKTVIHPSQIAGANNAFGPSPRDVERAQAVVSAYSEARAAGKSVAVLDGTMIEALHVRDAERILALDTAVRSRPIS